MSNKMACHDQETNSDGKSLKSVINQKLVIGNKSGFSFCWKVWKNSYWQRLLLPFILYLILLAKVIFTFQLVSPLIGKGGYYLSSCIFHLIGKGDYYLSSCISLIGKGNHYLLPCIFHLMGKGEYYLSTCILNLIGKGDYYHSPRSTY